MQIVRDRPNGTYLSKKLICSPDYAAPIQATDILLYAAAAAAAVFDFYRRTMASYSLKEGLNKWATPCLSPTSEETLSTPPHNRSLISVSLTKLSAELSRVVKTPEVVKRLSVKTDIVGSTPAEFARHVSTETERWRVLLKTIGVTLDE